jgi:hypothetical protein
MNIKIAKLKGEVLAEYKSESPPRRGEQVKIGQRFYEVSEVIHTICGHGNFIGARVIVMFIR